MKSLATAIAALGIIGAPSLQAQEKHEAFKGDRKPLTTEVTETFVDGYTVPDQYRTHFTEFPAIKGDDVVVRYQNGRAYYVNKSDWKIQQVVELDPSIKLEEESTVFVEGYMIPENLRTRFIEVPSPEVETSVRYYNNTAYYMNSDFQIIRTVRLTR